VLAHLHGQRHHQYRLAGNASRLMCSSCFHICRSHHRCRTSPPHQGEVEHDAASGLCTALRSHPLQSGKRILQLHGLVMPAPTFGLVDCIINMPITAASMPTAAAKTTNRRQCVCRSRRPHCSRAHGGPSISHALNIATDLTGAPSHGLAGELIAERLRKAGRKRRSGLARRPTTDLAGAPCHGGHAGELTATRLRKARQ
jgi:hypothetical protein